MLANMRCGSMAKPCRAVATLPRVAVSARHSLHRPSTLKVVCMAHPRRIAKVSSQIQREVSDLLVNDKTLQAAVSPERATTDNVTAVASITHVHVTNDLQHVKVYVSIYSDQRGKKTAFNNLKKLESYVRGHIGKRVRLRLTPEIVFVYDDAREEAELVARVLEEEQRRMYGPPPTSSSAYDDDDEEDEEEGEEGFFDVDEADEKLLKGYSSDDIFKQPGPFDSMFTGGEHVPVRGGQGKRR